MNGWPGLALTSFFLLTAYPTAAVAQFSPSVKPAREYVDLPSNGNLAALLKDRLVEITGRERLQDLVNEIRSNPKYQILAKSKDLLKLGGLEHLDASTTKALENLVLQSAEQLKTKFAPEDLEAMQHVLQQHKEELEKLQPASGKSEPPKPAPPKAKSAINLSARKAAESNDSRMADGFTKRTLDWLEHSPFAKLSELTQKSPAFLRSKEKLAASDPLAKALAKFSAGDRLPLPKLDWLRLPPATSSRLRSVVPSFGSLTTAPSFQLPTVSPPSGGWVLPILIALAFVGVLQVLVRKLLARRSRAGSRAALKTIGPWPVAPDRIATTAQLIEAFEYMALLLIGERARTANHRDIAILIGTSPERRAASHELATLYEKARYDPGVHELASSEAVAARRNLCLLTSLSESA
jgi:hypothetical protein